MACVVWKFSVETFLLTTPYIYIYINNGKYAKLEKIRLQKNKNETKQFSNIQVPCFEYIYSREHINLSFQHYFLTLFHICLNYFILILWEEKKKKKKIRISEFLAEQKTGMNMFFFPEGVLVPLLRSSSAGCPGTFAAWLLAPQSSLWFVGGLPNPRHFRQVLWVTFFN